MAKAGHQRQRHGVGNVGSNNAREGQQGVQNHQHGDTNGTRADRRQRDQRANNGAKQQRQAPVTGAGRSGFLTLGNAGGRHLAVNHLVQRGGGSQQQGQAQRGGHDFLHRLAGSSHVVQYV